MSEHILILKLHVSADKADTRMQIRDELHKRNIFTEDDDLDKWSYVLRDIEIRVLMNLMTGEYEHVGVVKL